MYILIVEDERRLAQGVRKGLEEEGHTVDVVHDGEGGGALGGGVWPRPPTTPCRRRSRSRTCSPACGRWAGGESRRVTPISSRRRTWCWTCAAAERSAPAARSSSARRSSPSWSS